MDLSLLHDAVDTTVPSRGGRLVLIAGGVTALFSFLILSRGINMNYDAWAFWQGSVSMLHGNGFVHFYEHVPVLAWPPLYAVYLLIWQAVFGVSGYVVIASSVALASLSAVFWLRLHSALRPRSISRYSAALLVIFITAFVAFHYKTLTSELLRFTLLPLMLLLLHRITTALHDRGIAGMTAGLLLAATALLLTHHSSMAFIAAAGLICCLQAWRRRSPRLLIVAVVMGLVPLSAWAVVRSLLQQWNSHPPLHGEGLSFFIENTLSYIAHLGTLFVAPLDWTWLPVLALLAFFCVALFRGATGKDVAGMTITSSQRMLLLFAVASAIAHLLISQPARIPALTRFAWHIPLILLPVAVTMSDTALRRWVRFVLPLVLVLPITVRMFGLAGATLFDLEGYISAKAAEAWITPSTTIHPDYVIASPGADASKQLVAPPMYPWVEEEARRRAAETR